MTDLLLRIARLRSELQAERHFAPSSSRPVLNYSWDDRERMMVPDEIDVSQIGATLSSKMQRVLSRSYGSDMGVQRALQRVEPWCARKHAKAGEPLHHERGYICPRLVLTVLLMGYGEQGLGSAYPQELIDQFYRALIQKAADDEQLEYREAAEFLSAALMAMERWITEWEAGAA